MACVVLQIERNGAIQSFTESCAGESQELNLSNVREAVKKVQQQSNAALTEMVNADKNGVVVESAQNDTETQSEGDDEDEDSTDGEEPPEKKKKS